MKITAKHIPPGHELVRVMVGEPMFRLSNRAISKPISECLLRDRPLIAAVLRDGWQKYIDDILNERLHMRGNDWERRLDSAEQTLDEITAWERGE